MQHPQGLLVYPMQKAAKHYTDAIFLKFFGERCTVPVPVLGCAAPCFASFAVLCCAVLALCHAVPH